MARNLDAIAHRNEAVSLLQHYIARASGKRGAAELSSDARLEILELVDHIIAAAVEVMREEMEAR